MAPESPSPASLDFPAQVAQAYSALIETANQEAGLGGRLFYAGELNDDGRACVVAANIAGAATLAATDDHAAQKRAIRDGVTDFLVNSLDEALRIVKNQLRKRETASVCLALSPTIVEDEMKERGILPDLVRSELRIGLPHEALRMRQSEGEETELRTIPALITWRVESGLPRDLAKLDEIALSCLDENQWQARRWLRVAPRYLGRLAQGTRVIESDREFAARFVQHVRERVACGKIAASVEIETYFGGLHDQIRFDPVRP